MPKAKRVQGTLMADERDKQGPDFADQRGRNYDDDGLWEVSQVQP